MPSRCHLFLDILIVLLCYLTSVRSDKDTASNLTIPGHGLLERPPRETPHSFNNNACNRTIVELGPLDAWGYFLKGALVNITSDNRTRMPLSECQEMCGTGYTQYRPTGIIRRLALWLVPVFMLVGNFQFPPLGPLNSFCIATHLFGDPIHTVYSLLVKLEVSRRILAH